MKIMVRFKGGTGGETFSWFLDESLNGYSNSIKDDQNRRDHVDALNFLQSEIIPNYVFPAYAGKFWYEIPIDLLKYRFDWIVAKQLTPYIIAKGHPNVMSEKYWSEIFPDWYMIDILPQVGRFWVTQVLQFYKVAFIKYTYDINKFSRYAKFNEVQEFFNKHGWIPGHWVWIMKYPEYVSVHALDKFFKRHSKSTATISKYQSWGRDCLIDGSNLVVDLSLSEFHKAAETFEIKIPSKVEEELYFWVSKNRSIFEELGILDKLDSGYEMDRPECYSFLRDLFWDKAVKLANGDSSYP